MPKISYRYLNGSEVGQWPGISYRNENGATRKKGQIFLGKVIDKEKMIFWKRSEGFYRFNPETVTCESVPPSDLPKNLPELDHARKSPPVIVDFGDAFFFDSLLEGLQYKEVLRNIHCSNSDTLLALLAFYTLDCGGASQAFSWYRQSYASYLYPSANLHEQRISEALRSIGSPESTREFLTAHIKYILDNTDTNLSVVIDSTGFPNTCDLPVTQVSLHSGNLDIEFRLIAVVQKSTGLPLYYEYIAGNIIDITAIERTILMLAEHKCEVQYCIGDAGYCCPSNIERLCLIGMDFMTKLSPNLVMFKKAFEENKERLFKTDNLVRYSDRFVNIVKIRSEIATDRETGEKHHGFIYLCVDQQERAIGIAHLLDPTQTRSKTLEELLKMQDRLGVFAIVSTRDLPESDLLPEYYVRQNIEQYFDFAKNYAAFLPIGKDNEETLRGHLVLSFISSFLFSLIKNRLDTAARKHVEVLSTLGLDSRTLSKITYGDGQEDKRNVTVLEQSIPSGIVNVTARWLFKDMRGQKADVFSGRIIPSVPTRQVMDIYEAFALSSPLEVKREGAVLRASYRKSPPEISRCRTLIFSRSIPLSDSEILSRRKKRKETATANNPVQSDTESTTDTAFSQTEVKKSSKGKAGRPKGAKNKKTLEREQQIAAGLLPSPIPKKGGRKRGSKDKVKRIRRTKEELAAVKAEKASVATSTPAEV